MVVPTALPMATFSLSGDPCSACWACVCVRVLIASYLLRYGTGCFLPLRLPQALSQWTPARASPGLFWSLGVVNVVKAADVVAHSPPGLVGFLPADRRKNLAVFAADHLCCFPPVLQPGVGLDHLAVNGRPEGTHQVCREGVAGGLGDPHMEGRIQPVELRGGDLRVLHLVQ